LITFGSSFHFNQSTEMKTLNQMLWVSIIAWVLLPSVGSAQTAVSFTPEQWDFTAAEYTPEEYKSKEAIHLKKGPARLRGVQLRNGIIEYDVAFPAGRAFIGVNFREQDAMNYEQFYMRSHQSGNPDATQYMPVYNGKESWQLCHGEGYNAPASYLFDQWMHVKLVVQEGQMEVYINDMNKPALFVPQLKRAVRPGTIALGGGARYANFSYTLSEKPPMISVAKKTTPAPEGTIARWQVSDAFPEKNLENVLQLPAGRKNGLKWQALPAESTGLLNLATGPVVSETNNTSFARVVIQSDKAQVKRLQLGFSDRARVYLNDQILYSGHDEFLSRDYRFLGTVGYYDEVYLPLKKGRNELWIAISETFGGWGLKGAIADQTGIKIE
jgi:hypothetical protein